MARRWVAAFLSRDLERDPLCPAWLCRVAPTKKTSKCRRACTSFVLDQYPSDLGQPGFRLCTDAATCATPPLIEIHIDLFSIIVSRVDGCLGLKKRHFVHASMTPVTFDVPCRSRCTEHERRQGWIAIWNISAVVVIS
ncbi:hypothetical protein A0H81_06092 [Grifola frondosa]|uniref:Uncharacterized protein n=1 Tax=Grifola frondosa TaxID=5627 RepID=A0A1C7MAU7_GRIFR|nr:hypothetical protein A0H81_06092 [Grifola frondosa]